VWIFVLENNTAKMLFLLSVFVLFPVQISKKFLNQDAFTKVKLHDILFSEKK